MKHAIIEDIVSHEWQFFTSTVNYGHRAPCQDQKGNFLASRRSYWHMYSIEVLQSYLEDIKDALFHGRNLVTFKYAYMMQYTHPEEYEQLREKLPLISSTKSTLVKSIMHLYMTWEDSIKHSQPHLDNHNRKLYRKDENSRSTSVETYMTGELLSYSEETLLKILSYFMKLHQESINPIIGYMERLASY